LAVNFQASDTYGVRITCQCDAFEHCMTMNCCSEFAI